MIVTPFAQILASLRNVRSNYMRLTNLTGLKGREYQRRSSTTFSPAAQISHQQTHPLSQPHRTSTSSIAPCILANTATTTNQGQQTTPITTPANLSSNNTISTSSTSMIREQQPLMSNQQISQTTPILTNQISTSSQQSSSNDQTINWNLISLQSNSNANCTMVEKMAIETLEELEWCLEQLEKISSHKYVLTFDRWIFISFYFIFILFLFFFLSLSHNNFIDLLEIWPHLNSNECSIKN